MKNLFLVFTFLISVGIAAQEKVEEVKLWTIYPGYVVTLDNDTTSGYIELSNKVENQKKALFYDKPDDENYTRKYKANDIKGFKVGPRYYQSFIFSPIDASSGEHFFLRDIDGPISVYEWYYKQQDPTDENAMVDVDSVMGRNEENLDSQLIAIKMGEEPQQLNKLKFISNFKKNMSKYVEDYPELAAKITNGEEGYRYVNIMAIIKEYNEWYLANH